MTSARKQLPIALSPYCQQQVLWLPPTVQAINISSTSSTRLNNQHSLPGSVTTAAYRSTSENKCRSTPYSKPVLTQLQRVRAAVVPSTAKAHASPSPPQPPQIFQGNSIRLQEDLSDRIAHQSLRRRAEQSEKKSNQSTQQRRYRADQCNQTFAGADAILNKVSMSTVKSSLAQHAYRQAKKQRCVSPDRGQAALQ